MRVPLKIEWAGIFAGLFATRRKISFNLPVLTDLFQLFKTETPGPDHWVTGSKKLPVFFVRHSKARRYLLRLTRDGTARVTIPRGGTLREAKRFVEKHRDWIERQFTRLQSAPPGHVNWRIGTRIWLRGEQVEIQVEAPDTIRFGNETLKVIEGNQDYRPLMEKYLRELAVRELPARVKELEALHGFSVRRITIRNQRTRWGSCSRTGAISLNWRLIQTPDFVRDYIILHELAHLRHMNHSDLFWDEVQRLCPEYFEAEKWLKQNRGFLN